jgi:hypothetical protein
MADTRTWTNGASTGVLNTAANWSGSTNPIAGDSIVFNGTQSADVTGGAAAFTALNFAEVNIEPSYGGVIADSGTPLELSATKFTFGGSGRLFLNNGSVANIDDLIINSPSGTVQIGDNSSGTGITRISLLACQNATLLSTLDTTTDLFVNSGVRVTLQGTNTITNAYVAAGATVTSTMLITNLRNSGMWTQMSDAQLITNAYLSAGTLKYLTVGQIDLLVVLPGAVADFTGDARVKVVDVARIFNSSGLRRSTTTSPTINNGGTLAQINIA